MPLELRPIGQNEALAYIGETHRHNVAPCGGVFCSSAWFVDRGSELLVGVGIAGRPVARLLNDGRTLEVLRVATDGTKNACSLLYGALVRAGKALGYRRFVTYTRVDEPGTSLRASGWRQVARVPASTWHRRSRPREDRGERVERWRWEIAA